MAIVQAPEQNRQAFLKLLRYCEFGRVSDGDYRMLYGFKMFSDYSTHPTGYTAVGRTKDGDEITTTAAGAYQIQQGTYDDAVDTGVVSDFSPSSQDKIALWLITSKGALLYIDQGQIRPAIQRLNRTWVSLPGGSHPKLSMDKAVALFNSYLTLQKGGVP